MMPTARIVACGGAIFGEGAERLQRFILALARAERPRVCFLPTATGDHPEAVAAFYRAASELDCRPSDLPLFHREVGDLREFLLGQDVIWVGGGNTANMLAIWRVHGVDRILREAWEEGIVLCGSSAGMNCWFEASVTDSYSLTKLAALDDGLGFLPGSACPHYDGESERRPTYHRLVADGFPAGHAADDGVGIVFEGRERVDVVAHREGAAAYWVSASGGEVSEERLDARIL
jgi:dipeptidase E